MKHSEKKIFALGAAIIAAAGLYFVLNKKSKGGSDKSDAAPKYVTPTPSAPVHDAERVKPKRRLRPHNISRVEINQLEASECNNFVSLPDGIIIVTDKGVTDALDAVYQKGQGKRHPAKDGGKHRGGRGKKKSGNSYMPNYKDLYYLMQKGYSGTLSPEEEARLKAELKAAKDSYDPQESRKSRNQRRDGKRA